MTSAKELKARNLVRSERKMVPKGDEKFSSEPGKSTIGEFEEQSRQDQRWRWSRCRGGTLRNMRGSTVERLERKPCDLSLIGGARPADWLTRKTLAKNVTRRRRSKMVKEMSKGGVSIRTKLFRDSPQDISHFRAALKA
ncbi:hypothetical protein V1477_005120 [Vespula maculifrons]|uniref:Uncharacterized protein n=1 Tax=Vespula maculifrons TaxID=7453 RepID=A0ABD2CNR4_VESMC